MPLSKDLLENFISNILEVPPDSVTQASEDWAQLIIEYARSAEFIATAPGVHPTSGAVDPSVVGTSFKVNPTLVTAGQLILQPALLSGFSLQDPIFIGLQLGISSFIPTLANWSAGSYSAIVVPTPIPFLVPGYFSPVIALGLGGASNDQIVSLLSDLIHVGFMTSVLNGSAVNAAGFVSPIVASPII